MTRARRRSFRALGCVVTALLVLPAAASAESRPPALDVRAAALIDAGTGQPLYGRSPTSEVAIASATKLMTALVALQHARLGRELTAPPYELAAVDSQIGLHGGERMTVGDLIVAMMLPSADDAAHDLAYNVGGRSADRFVAMMNAEAARLRLRHTHYTTPVGLDTPGNYSTAGDLVALARYALRTQPFLRRVVALHRAEIRVGGEPRIVTNLNGLVGRVPWVTGVKTGHTLEAGYVLVGSGRRDGMTLISTVLGASSESAREADTLALLSWGFEAFRLISPVSTGQAVARLPVKGRGSLRVALLATASYRRVVPRGWRVTTVLHAPRQLTGPLRKGAGAGRVVVMANGIPLASIPLRLARAVPAPPSGLTATNVVGPFTLVVLVLLLGAAIVRARRGRQAASQA